MKNIKYTLGGSGMVIILVIVILLSFIPLMLSIKLNNNYYLLVYTPFFAYVFYDAFEEIGK